jgi:DNA-binding NarL/FixJ family response regulator
MWRRGDGLERHPQWTPTVAVLDILMPNLKASTYWPGLQPIALSLKRSFLPAVSDGKILDAIARGAKGIVLKETALSDLARCIRAVAADRQ